MSNFDSVRTPKISSEPQHYINSDTNYLILDSYPYVISAPMDKNYLKKDELVTVLQHNIGYNVSWSRVRLNSNNVECYILSDKISPLPGTKPFIKPSIVENYFPSATAPKFNWRNKPIDTVLENFYDGVYSIIYDTNVEVITGEEMFQSLLNESLINGLQKIFENFGKEHLYTYIQSLQDKYYLLGYVEAVDIALRGCSTLKVVISVPMCYVHSPDVFDLMGSQFTEDGEPKEDESQEDIQDTLEDDSGESLADPKYEYITFTSKKNYDDFFAKLISFSPDISKWGLFNRINFIFSAMEWEKVPAELPLEFNSVIENFSNLKYSLIEYIFSNIPIERMAQFLKIENVWLEEFKKSNTKKVNSIFMGKDPVKIIKNAGFVSALEFLEYLKKDLLNIEWSGTIKLKVESENLKIVDVQYYPPRRDTNNLFVIRPIKFLRNKEKFLTSTSCTNPTLINYLLSAYENVSVEDSLFYKLNNISMNPAAHFEVTKFEGVLKDISNFIITYHYPSFDDVYAKPLDLLNCLMDSKQLLNDVLNNQSISAFKSWKDAIGKDVSQQYKFEGNMINNYLNGVLRNNSLRIILGQDTETKELLKKDPLAALSTKISPALQDLNIYAILSEVIKCATVKLSTQQFNALISEYNIAKEQLEMQAFATVCNPFIQGLAKEFVYPEIPLIPNYNPNKNLSTEITNYFVKITQDLLVMSMRELLKASMNICASDPNQEANAANGNNAANDLLDALENNSDNVNINDMIDDIIPSQETAGVSNTPTNGSGKGDIFKQIIKDFSCFLSTKETCDLLKGRIVSDEAYQIMLKVIEKKYPQIYNANKLTTKEEIARVYLAIAENIDMNLCDDLEDAPDIPMSCGCDDGMLQKARKTILENKGLPEWAIQAMMDDMNKADEDNVERILSALNGNGDPSKGDQPDFTKLPSVVCKRMSDGTIIPPIVDLSPSLDSFKSMLNGLFSDIYDTFDNESKAWSKSTYSISSSNTPPLTFNITTGKLDAVKDVAPQPNKSEIVPSYLFNDIIKNKKYSIKDDIVTFKCFIDGDKQQKLDANIIDQTLREQINFANIELSNFIQNFMTLFNTYLTIKIGELGVSTFLNSSSDLNKIRQTIENLVQNDTIFAKEFLHTLTLFDSFARNTKNKDDTSGYDNIEKLLSKNSEAIALYLQNSGATLYLNIGSFLSNKQYKFDSLINQLKSIVEAPGTPAEISRGSQLKSELVKVIDTYKTVEKIYKVVFSTSINFPEYDIEYYDNDDKNIEKVSLQNLLKDSFDKKTLEQKYNVNDVYEISRFDIKQNTISHIAFEGYSILDSDVSGFIKNTLGIYSKNPDKNDVFKAYITYLNPNLKPGEIPTNYYRYINSYIIDSIAQSVKNTSSETFETNPFLSKIKILDAITKKDGDKEVSQPATYKAITDYMCLTLDGTPTEDQKKCGIRPHYLDIDSIKDDAIDNKKLSICIEEMVNDKVRNNESVSSDELASLKINDTQNILLEASIKLTIRTYVHDILLRGVGVFGYYDPQFLRDEELFIDLIFNMMKSEIKGVDNTFYNMMEAFFVNKHNFYNPNSIIDINDTWSKNILIKQVLKEEFRKSILPKMAKRIMQDTNKKVNTDLIGRDVKFNLKRPDSMRSLAKSLKIQFEEKDGSIFILLPNNAKIKIANGNINSMSEESMIYRLLFEYLFPIKKYITVLFATNVFCTSTRKQILSTFNGTKSSLRRLSKTIVTNGQPLVPDPTNPQDVSNSNNDEFTINFILEAILKTPLMIAKGFMEAVDPNVALSAAQYKIAKIFQPEYPSWTIPAVGVPLGITAYFVAPLLPFALNIYNGLYYALGLWNDDLWNTPVKENPDDLLKKLVADNLEDCEIVKNHDDILKFDDKKGYVIINSK